VIELADHLSLDRFDYCGLSMGGAIGQQLALDYPDRVGSLVLCCTGAWMGGPQPWLARAERVRAEGMDWLVEASRDRWFRPGAEVPAGGLKALEAQRDIDPEGYASCCEALAHHDLRERISSIVAPTLVIAGEHDISAPAPMTELLAKRIPGASLAVIPGAAHIASLEQPDVVLAAITAHLISPMD
jgi:3-oxoadipate enol-lactonase